MTSSPEVGLDRKRKQHVYVAPPLVGRWKFMVVLGSFIVHVFLGGFNRCFGVIYLQLRHRYSSTAALTAGVGGLATAMRMSASPLATALSERIGGRMTTVIGGLLLATGVSSTAFVPNTETACFTLGILSGVGGSLTYVPSIVTVGHYFTTGRATALGVATSGSGIGVFIWPLLMEAMFGYYGYQGGMVLVGALMLHTTVAGCLYRPLDITHQNKQDGTYQVKIICTTEEEGDDDETLYERQHTTDHQEEIHCKQKKSALNCPSPCTTLARKLHLPLLKDRAFLSFFFTQVFCSASYWPAQMLLPALATSHDHSQSRAMLLLSILGITDVVGRLGGGALFDVPQIKANQRIGYAILLLVTAISIIAWPLSAHNYILMAFWVTVHGIVCGALVAMKGTMTGELVGTELLAGGLGLAVFAQGIGVMTAPPIAGLLRDITLVYTWSFVFLGALGLVAVIIFYVGAVHGHTTCGQRKDLQKNIHTEDSVSGR